MNPCGFAMLPAYLSYFLGIEAAKGTEDDRRASVGTALLVGAAVSAGFLVVFGIVGTLVNAGRLVVHRLREVGDHRHRHRAGRCSASRCCAAITSRSRRRGSTRAAATARSARSSSSACPTRSRRSRARCRSSSSSCSAPSRATNFVSGLATFLAYGLGMAMVLVTLTVALALAKQSVVHSLRHAMRYVDRVAGALLIVAGAYLVYYWIFNIATDYSSSTGSGPITFVEDLLGRASPRTSRRWGAGRVAVRARRRDRRVDLVRVRPASRLSPTFVGRPVFDELLAHPGVEEIVELRSTFGFMAYHGGSLEEVTDVVATAAAEQAGASLYARPPAAPASGGTSRRPRCDPEHSQALARVPRSRGRRRDRARLRARGHLDDAARRRPEPHARRPRRVRTCGPRCPTTRSPPTSTRSRRALRGLHPENPANLPRAGACSSSCRPACEGAARSGRTGRDRGSCRTPSR